MSNESPIVPSTSVSIAPLEQASAPAYFSSLEIQNVRCFGPQLQRLALADKNERPFRFTILLGDNGTGKTTLLQMLACMLPVALTVKAGTGTGPLLDTLVVPYGFIAKPMKYPRYHKQVTRPSRENLISVSISEGSKISEEQPYRKQNCKLIITPDGSFGGTVPFSHMPNLNVYAYGAIRRMGSGTESPTKYDKRISTLFDEKAELINAEEWLRQSDYVSRVAGTDNIVLRNRFETVKRLLIDLFPKDDIEDLSVEAVNEDKSAGTVEVFAKTPYGKVPLRTLSLGYRTLTAWMVDLASQLHERYPDSPNPLAEPAVVLVDEIDLHLHPRWQRQIFRRLANLFPNTQFIVTAHSPLIVQAAEDANIIVLRRPADADYVVIEQAPDAVRNWRIDQIMTSDLFGLPSARRPELDLLITERRELLKKASLTLEDEARLNELEKQLASLPGGENPEEMRLMGILHKIAQRHPRREEQGQ